nr:hypothetical protein [Tanacetum cinerariifolium]
MAFKNFMFAEDDEDLSFLPKNPSPGFGTSSPSVSINIELPFMEAESLDEANTEHILKNVADSGSSLVCQEKLVIHLGSVVVRIKDKKCMTRGSSKPPVKRRLVQGTSSSRDTHQKTTSSKYESLFLMGGECEVLKDRVKEREKECKDLKAKCKAAMADFDNNPAVNILYQKIKSFFDEVKEHKASLDRMLLESKKWVGYQVSLSNLESKFTSLEAKKVKLEASKLSLCQERVHARCVEGSCDQTWYPIDVKLLYISYVHEAWGRSSYARAMIVLRANAELKDILVVVVSKLKDEEYSLSTIRIASLYDQHPIIEKEVNLKSVDMPSTSIEEEVEELDSEVEDVHDDKNQILASLSNRDGGGANDANLLEDEYYDIYDGYENDAYDGLTEDQLAFCDTYGIHLWVGNKVS